MSRQLAFRDIVIDEASPRLQGLLEQARVGRYRPLCLCRSPGVPLYIARMGTQLVLKRMPESGTDHALSCESYEPPAELSGMGQVLGHAIREDGEPGWVTLRLQSSLTKLPGRTAPAPGEGTSSTAKAEASKLSLRGLLHYLWTQGGLHRWSPAMAGKRSWSVIHRQVLLAAEGARTRAGPLTETLYLPEPFVLEHKVELLARRQAQFAALAAASRAGRHRLALVIGDVKEIVPSRYGHHLWLRHQPDLPFQLAASLHDRIARRFETALGLWSAQPDAHLVLVGTFSVAANGLARLEEVTLVCMTRHWIPFESAYEAALLDWLTSQGRRFIKGLRFELAAEVPLATAVLTDTPNPVALYILPPGATDRYSNELEALSPSSRMQCWVWDARTGAIPPLPTVRPAP